MTVLLTGNLPLLAGAPNGIKKLRQLILELAVRGKLVPQDPSDEPASELLKRIAEEKARLVGEGKAKKQKVLAEIGEEKTPFELPVGWVWCRLSELAVIRGGCTPSMSKSEFWDGGIPWVSPKDMHTGDVADSELKVTQLALVSSSLELVPVGSILLVGRSGILKRKLPVQLTTVPCTINQDLKAISPYQPLLPRYVQLMLMGTERLILVEDVKQGTTVQSIVYDRLFSRLFGLPPLSEQHRVVAKVDELMALCDRLEARQADADSAHTQLVQALLDSLTQARDAEDFAESWQRLAEHFHTLFTTESSIDALKQTLLQLAVMGKLVPQDPCDEPVSELLKQIAEERARLVAEGKIRNPKVHPAISDEEMAFSPPGGWQWVRKVDVFKFVNGYAFKSEWFQPKGIRLLRNINVAHGEVDWAEAAYLSEEQAAEYQAFSLVENDVVLTLDRPIISGGLKYAVIRRSDLPCLLLQRVAKISPYAESVTVGYFATWLNSTFFVRAIDPGRSNGVPHISTNQVAGMPFALPPLAEQHRIVAKVDQLMALCDQLKARLGEARQVHGNLANALIGQALNNEKKSRAEAVDFSAYLISKLASRRTFGRVAHMKLLFLADSHLGLGLMDGYRRHAAGPLDTTIYRVEERAAQEGLYSTSIEVLKSGQEKVSYHIGDNISRSVGVAAAALGAGRKELDRLIALFEGRKTDDLEVVATLYAVWNDALAGGLHPNDEWLINEFRSNWHEVKERFAPDILGKWLGWMRDNGLVPTGNSAVTKSQAAFLFN
ncbi:restriction endonuclease subunit S [Xanthomonas campestris]|uniref:restriction endonuclease subunit S n=1 Tax=Xanthomonas campestris TaxID=339 RepID=UPI001E2FEB19|nr:restriction endonuclease subunit S [Xanthomonas campestris]MCC5049615.1 restriction endonuclease subunit S [Xanthomonas campestris]MCC5057917.1 restriction endonuclease subunit S [Xanthomonas campestris]MCC5062024.1 restriction endonuclease subunit S [Xanthomonas campestris]